MVEALYIAAAVIIIIVVILGASSIITAYEKTPPFIKSFQDETNARCDLCLHQFDEVRCDHTSTSRLCTALRDSYCITNCTIQLQN